MKDIVNSIKEELVSIWKLMSDTRMFLTKIKKFDEYEKQFREWRAKLQKYPHDANIRKEIRKSIIVFRNYFRTNGYNLKLGSKDIKVFSFKSDDATALGFRRMVLIIDNNNVYYITGDENHLELLRFLSRKLNAGNDYYFKDAHHLWYRWHNNVLQIYGSDSEDKNQFEKLKIYIENNKNYLLKQLKNLN